MTTDVRLYSETDTNSREIDSDKRRGRWWDSVFQGSEDCLIVCRFDGSIGECNRKAALLLERTSSVDSSPSGIGEYLSPPTALRLAQIFKLKPERPETLPSVTLLNGGRILTIIDLVVTTLDAGSYLITIKDASRRWRMESHVQRLMTAIDATTEVFFLTDSQLRLTFVNAAFQTNTGYSIEDALGQASDFLRSPSSHAQISEYLEALHKGLDWSGELINRRADGSEYPVEAVISPIHDRSGKFIGYVACERDISSKNALKEDLVAERDLAHSIINSMDAAIYAVDSEFHLTQVNEGWRKFPTDHGWLNMLGGPKIGELFLDCVPDDQKRVQLTGYLVQVMTGGSAHEFEVDEGGGRWSLVSIAPWRHKGRSAGFIYSVKDQSRVRELQRQLYDSQKMEVLGCLAAGVAHDFNNLLQVIQGNAQLAVEAASSTSCVPMLQQISQAAAGASAITAQLLGFSRSEEENLVVFDFNDRIQLVGGMAARSARGSVRIEVHPAPRPVWICMDSTRADQLLLNLCVNAQDAMPQGGLLSLNNNIVRLDEHQASQLRRRAGDEFLCCSVTDTGSGISPEVLPHIFETFYTTKQKGKGTGLGLSIAQRVVTQAGGWLDVRSEVGKGTTFLLFVPLASAPVPGSVPEVTSEASPSPRGHGVILVVEDQEMVRDFTATFLRAAGYEVITADTADAALESIRSNSGPINLVLTDYNMPGMNGLELIEQLAYERPGIKSILVSGFLDEEQMARVEENGTIQLLRKPYNHKQALRIIDAALAPS